MKKLEILGLLGLGTAAFGATFLGLELLEKKRMRTGKKCWRNHMLLFFMICIPVSSRFLQKIIGGG